MNLGDISDLVCILEFSPELKIIDFNDGIQNLLGTELKKGSSLLNYSANYQENSFVSQLEIGEVLSQVNKGPIQVVEAEWDWIDKNQNTISTIIKVKAYNGNYLCIVESVNVVSSKYKQLSSDYFALNDSVMNIPQLFFVTDIKGNFTQTNKFFQQFFSIDSKDVKNYNIDKDFNLTRKYIVRDKFYSISEDLFVIKGNENWFKTYRYAILNQDAVPYAHGHIAIDTTREKLLEKEVDLARAQAFASSKLATLGEMAGGIAHEINNPLTIINSYNKKLRQMVETEIFDRDKFIKMHDIISKTIIRITKIINGLRVISRDSSHEERDFCKLADIVNDTLDLCRERFKNSGIEIQIDLEEEIYQTVINCYRVQLSQVFVNLLLNAFDAVERLPSPWVKITCASKDDKLEICFIDSGDGIPEDIRDKILNPFFTTKEIGKGTGLGLSLSNSVIKNHGGEFKIDSESKHTCFVVTLPIDPSTLLE